MNERRAAQDAALSALASLPPANLETARHDQEKAAGDASQALLKLMASSRRTRTILLQTALQDPADAQRLKGREQGLSVALSQVRSADARALFQQAILPALHNSSDPLTLKEAVEFMDRWSIPATLSPSENDSLAGALVKQMLNTRDIDAIQALANGVTLIAANVSQADSDDLAWKLAERSTQEQQSTISDARLPALLALERALGTDSAGKLASKLIDRMLAEQDPYARRNLAMEARDPDAKLNAAVAGGIADKVAERIIAEVNPTSMGAWGAVLGSLKDEIDPAKAGDLAGRLAPRILLDLDLAGSDELFSGWRALAEKATPEQSEKLLMLMTGAFRIPSLSSHAVRRLAATLAALPASPSAFAPAGDALLGRMRSESDPTQLGELGSAVAALRAKLPPANVDDAADILVRRMVSTRDGSELGPLAGALDDLDESIGKPKIGEFATLLAARMGVERSSMGLLNLAVGFIALVQQLPAEELDTAHPAGLANSLAGPLLTRMQSENNPPALRTLAFSLGAIEDGADPGRIRAAGSKLASAMATETDADDLRALTAGLCALKAAAGQENLDKAASVLSARIGIESDPVVLFGLASSLHALAGYVDPGRFQAPASNLVSRMIETGNPGRVRGLSRSLNKIAPNLSAEVSAKLASDLVARIESQQQPELRSAYGEALGLLPEGSLSAAQLGEIQSLFAVPDAPCQVVTRVTEGGPGRFVPEILNPLCSEDSWTQVVSAFDDATKESIVHPGAQVEDSGDADFKQLVVADDDDEASAASAAAAADRTVIDFNRLSSVLDRFRPAQSGGSTLARDILSSGLFLTGLILLWFAFRRRSSAV